MKCITAPSMQLETARLQSNKKKLVERPTFFILPIDKMFPLCYNGHGGKGAFLVGGHGLRAVEEQKKFNFFSKKC